MQNYFHKKRSSSFDLFIKGRRVKTQHLIFLHIKKKGGKCARSPQGENRIDWKDLICGFINTYQNKA